MIIDDELRDNSSMLTLILMKSSIPKQIFNLPLHVHLNRFRKEKIDKLLAAKVSRTIFYAYGSVSNCSSGSFINHMKPIQRKFIS